MAAYAATVTTPLNRAERISRSLGMIAGKYNLTNYNTTLVKQTSVTKYFATGGVSGFTQGIIAVIPTGVSDNGHVFEWDYTTGCFKAYRPTTITVSGSATGAGLTIDLGIPAVQAVSTQGTLTAVATESADDVDVGEVGFIAIGFVK